MKHTKKMIYFISVSSLIFFLKTDLNYHILYWRTILLSIWYFCGNLFGNLALYLAFIFVIIFSDACVYYHVDDSSKSFLSLFFYCQYVVYLGLLSSFYCYMLYSYQYYEYLYSRQCVTWNMM
jgi:hypothetical protein